MFRELGLGSYHITHKRRRESIKHLIDGIFNLKIIHLKKPFSFLKRLLSLFVQESQYNLNTHCQIFY